MKKISAIHLIVGIFLGFQIVYYKANQSPKSLRRGPGEGHAIFRKHRLSKLNVSPTFAEAVKSYKQCLRNCAANSNCWSANFGTKEVLRGLFLCELLPKDKYNASSSFVSPVEDFVHYSIKTPCLDFPCQYGGTCIANYFEDTYNCTCSPGFKGNNCEEGCTEFELITLEPHQLSASSTYTDDTGDKRKQYQHAPFNGILNNKQNRGAWCAEHKFSVTKDTNQYLSIDLGTPTYIGKVATQGQEYWDNWVSTYVLKFSVDNIIWQNYPKTLQGNNDRRTIKENILDRPVLTRFVRFNPTSFYTNDICLRVGIYKCKETATAN